MSKRILVAGGTGFVGSRLCKHLLTKNHTVAVLTRSLTSNQNTRLSGVEYYTKDQADLPAFDVFINVAGLSLNRRWNSTNQVEMRDSRIGVTETLVEFIAAQEGKQESKASSPPVLINASAIGFYGTHPDGSHQPFSDLEAEALAPSDAKQTAASVTLDPSSFSQTMCWDWEAAANVANAKHGARVCTMRLGVVFGKGGGMLAQLKPIFWLNLGAQLGSGQQMLSWVHMTDVIGMCDRLIEDEKASGAYNFTSPNPASNKDFTAALAKTMHRFVFPIPIPAFFLRIVLGKGLAEDLILNGQSVLPDRMSQELGYEFQYPTIDSALNEVFK
jgi:uncharacterized protein (TIGR01777 family)